MAVRIPSHKAFEPIRKKLNFDTPDERLFTAKEATRATNRRKEKRARKRSSSPISTPNRSQPRSAVATPVKRPREDSADDTNPPRIPKRARLELMKLSPIKGGALLGFSEYDTVRRLDLSKMWAQDVCGCIKKLRTVTDRGQYYGNFGRNERALALTYGGLIFALSSLEVVCKFGDLAVSVHDIMSEEARETLVSDGEWVPRDINAFERWLAYLHDLSQCTGITADFEHCREAAILVFARVQRACIEFASVAHATEMMIMADGSDSIVISSQ